MRDIVKRLHSRFRYSYILLKELVISDFKLRYQGSVLGYLWSLLRPLMLFLVLYVVFVKVLRTGGDVPHFGVYLLLGIVIWNYFVEVTTGSVGAIVGKGELLRKVNFPRYVVVLAGSFSALINLILNLLVVSFFLWIGRAQPNHFIVFFPLLIVELFVFSLALAFILSAAYVRFRDLNYIWEVIIQIAFYATPILYAFSYISGRSMLVAKVMILSPIAQIIQDARFETVTNKTTTVSTVYGHTSMRILPVLLVLFTAVIAVVYFKREAPHFAENV